MSIHWLLAIAILALILVLAAPTMRVLRYIAEVHEAKQRRRHAVRRRERCKGFLPVHDEQWTPPTKHKTSVLAERELEKIMDVWRASS